MKLWTVKDLVEKFKVDKTTIIKWCRKGCFPNAYRNPDGYRSWVIPDSDVRDFKRPQYRTPSWKDKYPLTEADLQEIITYYERGASQTDVSIKFKIPLPHISKILKEAGVEIRPFTVSRLFLRSMKSRRKLPSRELIVKLYQEQGLSRQEIFSILGVSGATFSYLLIYYQIPKRRFHAKK